jgi:DNA-binding IclR family transcriptional regulator
VRNEKPLGDSVRTLTRGLHILRAFRDDRPELTQSQIAEVLDLPLPTVGRLCRTLLAEGFLEGVGETRRLRLGPEIARLALVAPRDPVAIGRTWMADLAERFGEDVNLAVLNGTQVLYVDSIASRRTLSANTAIGTRVPAHCTAVGKCLLAQLDDNVALDRLGPGPYERRTAKTLTGWGDLQRELESIRSRQVAQSFEEFEEGLVGLAVALTRDGNGPVYGLSVAIPSVRARPEVVAQIEDALRAGPRVTFTPGGNV